MFCIHHAPSLKLPQMGVMHLKRWGRANWSGGGSIVIRQILVVSFKRQHTEADADFLVRWILLVLHQTDAEVALAKQTRVRLEQEWNWLKIWRTIRTAIWKTINDLNHAPALTLHDRCTGCWRRRLTPWDFSLSKVLDGHQATRITRSRRGWMWPF